MYTKQTWNTGDVITEEKLNHIEEGVSTGGGIYSVENVTYFDGEVTTEPGKGGMNFGYISIDNMTSKKELQITFNGEEYTLPYVADSEERIGWGELDDNSQPAFSNYPIFVDYPDGQDIQEVAVYTAGAGTYSLTIKDEDLQINSEFKEKINSVIIPVNIRNDVVFKINNDTADFIEVSEDLNDVIANNWVYVNDFDLNLLLCVKGKIKTVLPADEASVPSGKQYLANDCQGFFVYYVVPQLEAAPTFKPAVIVKEGTATFKNKLD